jgi:hypothetical protein
MPANKLCSAVVSYDERQEDASVNALQSNRLDKPGTLSSRD